MLIQRDGQPVSGIFWKLEDAATLILLDDRRAMESNKISDRNDWLNDEQLELRRSREVYASQGSVDAHFLRGQFSRAWHFREHRPTRRHRYSFAQDPWRLDLDESFGGTGTVKFMPHYSRPDGVVEKGSHYTWDIMLPHKAMRNDGE